LPRKCSATNRILTAKDHSSVQINIAQLNASGIYEGNYTTVAFSGFIRNNAGSDQALNVIAAEKGLMKDLLKFPAQHKFRGEAE